MTAHPLLVRLVRKVGAGPAEPPSAEGWRELLALVSRTYLDADQDRYTLERSIEISSREMQGLYEELEGRTASELASERERVVESDAIIRATLEAASEGIVVVDRERRVIAANRRFAEMAGVSRELLETREHGRIVDAVASNWKLTAAARARIDAIHATTETFQDELLLADGRVIDRYSAPVQLEGGRSVGRVTFFRDVTAERLARREIEAARATAETASLAKSMFVANMSHELRTPLNAVIGLSDLLMLEGGEPLSERQREYIDGIATSGRHLLALVNGVLDLAKIEVGRNELALEDVAVRDAIEEGTAALVPLAQQRGVALVIEVEVETQRVRADRVRLRQVLYNLISNAVKFTEHGGRVAVRSRRDGEQVAIEVADTGIGIAAGDMSRLFRAFEQIELPSGDRPAGTGLGLALTKRLVEMHGGTIAVASKRGVGTTFTVRIPGPA